EKISRLVAYDSRVRPRITSKLRARSSRYTPAVVRMPIALASASSIRTSSLRTSAQFSGAGGALPRLDHAQPRDLGTRGADGAEHRQDQHRAAEHHQVHAGVKADRAGQRQLADQRQLQLQVAAGEEGHAKEHRGRAAERGDDQADADAADVVEAEARLHRG